MKKFLSLLMATLMLASVLTACGGKKEEAPAQTATEAPAEAPAATGSELTCEVRVE